MELIFDIFTQKGELYESVRIAGEDDEDIKEQLDGYLSTKMDCYAQEVDEDE